MSKNAKRIRRTFRVLFVIIVILLAAMIILPMVFKGRIMELAKTEINNNVNAKIDFQDFGMNLFTNFPNFSFHLDEISIVGIDDFSGDTLAEIASVSAVIDVMSVIGEDVYEIKRISIIRPDIHLKILEDGKANYNIVPEGDSNQTATKDDNSETAAFNIALRKFEIVDGNIVYEDAAGGIKVLAIGFDHSLSGDLSADRTSLKTQTKIDAITFIQGGIPFLNNTSIDFDAGIDADLKNEVYTFRKNKLKINELALEFEGSVAMAGGDPDIILTFNAPKNTFKNFLSLVPAIYQKDFNDIQTKGGLAFNGYVKGVYSESNLPSFSLDVKVDNAEFNYPDLPAALKDINLEMNVDNSGGDVDNTIVEINELHFSMKGHPFDASLLLKNPVSDPYIDASLKGLIDLAALAELYPLEEGESMRGTIDANISLKGRQSTIEKKDYTKFDASGSLLVKELNYMMEGFESAFEIGHAQLNLAPAYIDLVNLDFKYADSDIQIKGKITNYIPYLMSDQVLGGSFTASSNVFNVNQFMLEEEEPSDAQNALVPDTTTLTAFMVPANIDLKLVAQFAKVYYDKLELDDVAGTILLKYEKVSLQNLRGDILNGRIGINGSYSTQNTTKPIVDFDLDISKISVQQAYNSFGILQKFAPIFQNALGDFSTKMAFNTTLKEDMNPDWKTFVGEGLLNTTSLKLAQINTLDKLSEVLKMDLFKSMDLDPVNLSFDIKDGKLIVKPFDFMMEGMKGKLSGWTAIDESIGYNLNMDVPRELFGGEANNVLDGLVSQANASGANFSVGETVGLGVLIGGTLSNPTIKPSIGKSGKGIIGDVKQNAKEELNKKKEELEEEAKAEAQKIINEAEKQAQAIMNEARKQADQVKTVGRDAAQTAKSEADSHANQLIVEGKKKGVLAEVAAKKAAEEYKKTAYREADKLITEADKKAEGIMNEASRQADKIRSDARKKAGL